MASPFDFDQEKPASKNNQGGSLAMLAGCGAVGVIVFVLIGACGYGYYSWRDLEHAKQKEIARVKETKAKEDADARLPAKIPLPVLKKKEPAKALPDSTPIVVQSPEPTAKEWLDKGIQASKKQPERRGGKLDLSNAEADFVSGVKVCSESREDQLVKAELWLRLSVLREWRDGFPDNDAIKRAETIMRTVLVGPKEVAAMRIQVTRNQYGILSEAFMPKSK